jgi:hypothetical protein
MLANAFPGAGDPFTWPLGRFFDRRAWVMNRDHEAESGGYGIAEKVAKMLRR